MNLQAKLFRILKSSNALGTCILAIATFELEPLERLQIEKMLDANNELAALISARYDRCNRSPV